MPWSDEIGIALSNLWLHLNFTSYTTDGKIVQNLITTLTEITFSQYNWFKLMFSIKKNPCILYVGMCMPACSCIYVCLRVAYVKPNLSAYAIHMVPHIANWLFQPCTIFIRINWTTPCACHYKRTYQSAHASIACSVFTTATIIQATWETLTRLHNLAQVFINNSGNICRTGIVCIAIYSLQVSCSGADALLLLRILTEKPTNN